LIDAGDTLEFAKQHLLTYGATQVESIVLVKKKKVQATQVTVAIFGFEAPDVWLTSMGSQEKIASIC
jgi:hypoxanthine-guanine phosphoribosyltransferase